MAWRNITLSIFLVFAAISLVAIAPQSVVAQDLDADDGMDADGMDADGTDMMDGGQTDSTIGVGATSGVMINAEGVLRRRVFSDPTGNLRRQRISEARAALDRELTARSKLRKVSLNRLEQVLARHLETGQPPTDAMRFLAGLTRLKYVFFYPETGDIVVAGPAEGWFHDPSGRVLSMHEGRPVLELQDLIVALRAYPPSGEKPAQVSCSIDPTPEGLVRLQEFLAQMRGRVDSPADTPAIVDGMQRSLGLQEVTIRGISANTHFAEVMVEADYRMKLIGIGLEIPPVPLRSYVSLASPSAVSRNAMQRWYFVPNYECVRVSDDELAMELVGDGVKLVGESEVVGGDGSRSRAAKSSRASQMFTLGFTRQYPRLAAEAPVYAQLRNLIDMLVAAAFIQQQDYYGQSGWMMRLIGDEKAFSVETNRAPKRVATAVNGVWKGSKLMLPIGGGVSIRAEEALDGNNMLMDEKGLVDQTRQKIDIKALPKDQWWWD